MVRHEVQIVIETDEDNGTAYAIEAKSDAPDFQGLSGTDQAVILAAQYLVFKAATECSGSGVEACIERICRDALRQVGLKHLNLHHLARMRRELENDDGA